MTASSKRLSSSALASQLHRNGSRRNSQSSDEMYPMDVPMSIEDDVLDLNQKVNELQQQVATLTDNQINTDQRYNKVKQENAALQNNFKNGKSPSHSTQISFVPRRRLASSNDSLRTKNSCVLLRNANLPFKFETSGHQSKNLHVFDICMLVQKLLSPDS
ncbi:rab11 family-interacting protein 4A [Trichonephila clavata]|uniref:Rab11 family-interacting protein 4A n=1 Tax=Trichonephila clavata TaxID=2740835 RepID=A0A8X6G9B0_TRICU|nr:rab11 family-interacting protein 4A [Trichonephila clavata]